MTWLGYSEGEFRANDHAFTSGGQCEDGLKMIIVIGDIEVPTSDGKTESIITCIKISLLQCHVIIPTHDIHTHNVVQEVVITDISTSDGFTTDGSFLIIITFTTWDYPIITTPCMHQE